MSDMGGNQIFYIVFALLGLFFVVRAKKNAGYVAKICVSFNFPLQSEKFYRVFYSVIGLAFMILGILAATGVLKMGPQ